MNTDWTKWTADLLVASISGLVGGTLFASLRGYFTKKGEHVATYQDIQFLLAQEHGKAYEQEKGKRLATHEDIENVLQEVKTVTRETETIRAQIGSDLWMRQMVWQQKRDCYAKILSVSHQVREALIDLVQALRSTEIYEGSQNQQMRLDANQNFGKAQNRYFLELAPALANEIDVAEMFLGPKGVRILQEFRSWRQSMESGTEFQARVDFVAAWRNRLIEAARKDLGVPEFEQN